MDNILNNLLTVQFIIFCLSLSAITFVIRKLVEFYVLDNPKMPGSKTSKFWTSLFLPIAPIVNGALFGAYMTQFPYPDGITSFGSRVLFGLMAGLVSAHVYRVIKGLLKVK